MNPIFTGLVLSGGIGGCIGRSLLDILPFEKMGENVSENSIKEFKPSCNNTMDKGNNPMDKFPYGPSRPQSLGGYDKDDKNAQSSGYGAFGSSIKGERDEKLLAQLKWIVESRAFLDGGWTKEQLWPTDHVISKGVKPMEHFDDVDYKLAEKQSMKQLLNALSYWEKQDSPESSKKIPLIQKELDKRTEAINNPDLTELRKKYLDIEKAWEILKIEKTLNGSTIAIEEVSKSNLTQDVKGKTKMDYSNALEENNLKRKRSNSEASNVSSIASSSSSEDWTKLIWW